MTTPIYRNYYRQRTANQWRKIPAEHGDPSAIRPFLAGNWKMNLIPRAGVALAARIFDLCRNIRDVDMGFAPPFTGLSTLADYIEPDFLKREYGIGRNVFLLAQDTFFESKGAFTGEISADMLAAIGVDRVIIGHSDRRANLGKYFGFSSSVARRLSKDFLSQSHRRLSRRENPDIKILSALGHLLEEDHTDVLEGLEKFLEHELNERAGESDEAIQRKVHAALANGLQIIFCCGENREARRAHETFDLLERQIRIGLEGVARPTMPEIIIAYEPIWAIGEGAKPAPPEQIAEVHDFIRNLLMDLYGEQVAARVRILYGGNVKPDNINEIMELAGVDGALVGGASLNASDFSKIIRFGLPD
jgi:triosephosphate isomerase